MQPADKTILTYQERPADQNMALSAWFYPGDNMGQQFVYPKSEAEQLSRLNNQEVPSTGSEEAYPQLKERATENAESQNQAPPTHTQEAPTTQTTNPPPAAKPIPPAQNNEVAKNTPSELPHTASMLPSRSHRLKFACDCGLAAESR